MSEKTSGRLLYILFALLVAAVFLTIGLTVPALPGLERKEFLEVTYVPGTTTAVSATQAMPVDKLCLNTATKEELLRISGIGDTFADRIIAYREEHGGFRSVEELKQVDGIGEKRYARWAPYFTISE